MGKGIRTLSITVVFLLLGSFGLYQESFAITADEITVKIEINESNTRPTFGLSHEDNKKIVDAGFSFDKQTFVITDNFHTPFAELPVNIGELNYFSAKVYAEHGLKVQEFLFGIPQKGDAHLAELGIEVQYGIFGEIQDIKVIQKSNVIDTDSIFATHEKIKCLTSDIEKKCDLTKISMTFLEPLQDKVMAIKAIDFKKRYQITYLNEGLDISGESLNPMLVNMISSSVRDEGILKVTQVAKYSPYWSTEDGRMFEMNSFGSFKEINRSFERFQDTGNALTRLHSGFGGIMANQQEMATDVFDASELISELPDYTASFHPKIIERINEEMKEKIVNEQEIATDVFDASELISELPESFTHYYSNNERMDEEMKEKMLEQEKICQNILNKYTS